MQSIILLLTGIEIFRSVICHTVNIFYPTVSCFSHPDIGAQGCCQDRQDTLITALYLSQCKRQILQLLLTMQNAFHSSLCNHEIINNHTQKFNFYLFSTQVFALLFVWVFFLQVGGEKSFRAMHRASCTIQIKYLLSQKPTVPR